MSESNSEPLKQLHEWIK